MNDYINTYKAATYKLRGNKGQSVKEEMSLFANLDNTIMPDLYGTGDVIERFEEKIATELGKESAIFFPSGTMAQQIAMRIWCDEKNNKRVAYHPLCHLEIHEQDGIKELHHIEPFLLGDKDRLFTLNDILGMPDVAVVLFELPQREIGGQLPSWDDLIEMVSACNARGFHTHLDGARLYECLPYYGKTAREVAALFDSAYLSFYKGFGGVTGAMLAGPKDFMNQAKVWKRRYGGDLYHLYPYIISADTAFELRKNRMSAYYKNAVKYAALLSQIQGVSILPAVPVSNMFHVHFTGSEDVLTNQLIQVMTTCDVALIGSLTRLENGTIKSEMSLGDAYDAVPEDKIIEAIGFLKKLRR